MTNDLKQCRVCHVFQPIEAFPLARNSAGSRHPRQRVTAVCHDCTRRLRKAEKARRNKMQRKAG